MALYTDRIAHVWLVHSDQDEAIDLPPVHAVISTDPLTWSLLGWSGIHDCPLFLSECKEASPDCSNNPRSLQVIERFRYGCA